MMKKQNVMEEDWDTLIVLDACRYDYFEKVYDEYLDGDLERRNSEAGATPEWLCKQFTDEYDYFDVSYFSANPHINSKGIGLERITKDLYSWKPTDHFPHIIDVWKKKWDKNLGTVYPSDLVDIFLNFPRMSRSIIHFLQPHLPFIHPESKFEMESGSKRAVEGIRKNPKEKPQIFTRVKNYIFYDLLRKLTDDELFKWTVRDFFGVSSLGRYERIFGNGQFHRITEFYNHGIEETLFSVKRLIKGVDGKVVITADHGECFGEYNTWGHENENHNPILTTVPWLEVDKNE